MSPGIILPQFFYREEPMVKNASDFNSFFMFAPWKRLEKMAAKPGARMVVGYNYRNPESSDLISLLFGSGVAIWTNTSAAMLATLFRSSRCNQPPKFDSSDCHCRHSIFQEALCSCHTVWWRREANLGGKGFWG